MALMEQSDNYPGFDGFTLGERIQRGAERFGTVTELTEVCHVQLAGAFKALDTGEGVFRARTVVVVTGTASRILSLPDEEALAGRSVCYCAACDGALYQGKTASVIGGTPPLRTR